MRRKDREIDDAQEMDAILSRCDAVSIAFAGPRPYVVPMSFGFVREGGRLKLYMHCAGAGEKLARMEENPHVAFAAYRCGPLEEGETACAYSTAYESVCGSGTLCRVSGEEKERGLRILMEHYAPGRSFSFQRPQLEAVTVLRLDAQEASGKRRSPRC